MQAPVYDWEGEEALMLLFWSPEVRDDPEAFVMASYPWGVPNTPLEDQKGPRKWQRQALRDVRDAIRANRDKAPDEQGEIIFDVLREAIASGRGIGKSALVSWLAHWFVTTRIGGTVVISANTEAQLATVTWAELYKWFQMGLNSHWFELAAQSITPAKWLKELVTRDLKKGTKYWGIQAKLWSEENPDAYAGIHNMDGVMLIFDEASGIADNIWGVAAGFFTENTPNRFWLAFSNPRRNRGYFFECFNSKRDFWKTRNIDARDVEGTDKAVYREIIDEHGEDSYEAHVEVYGQFPEQGDDQFISPMLVEGCFNRAMTYDDLAPIVIGVDPARSGADSTVVAVRQGRDLIDLQRFKNKDLMVTVGDVIVLIEQYEPDGVYIDEGGLGAGVVDRLKEQGYKVRGVTFNNSARNGRMYVNKRSEMWGDMRTWLGIGSMSLFSKDKRIKDDMTAPMVKHDSGGAIQLESKVDMKKRGKASPDSADAIAITFAYPVARRRHGRGVALDRGRRSGHNGGSHGSSWMGA